MTEFNADFRFFLKVGLILLGFVLLASSCSPILAHFDLVTGYGTPTNR